MAKKLSRDKLSSILSWLRGMPWYPQLRRLEKERFKQHDYMLRRTLALLVSAKTGTISQKEVIIDELVATLKSYLAQH